MFDFLGCQIHVPPEQMSAIVRTESSAQPFAIGVVGHYLNRQPQNLQEANQVISLLKAGGYNYSVGLAQVNQSNFSAFGLTSNNMFDRCHNLKAGSKILRNCYTQHQDWSKAYSCYYSGNPTTGFRHGYVDKVLRNKKQPILTTIATAKGITHPIRLIARNRKSNVNPVHTVTPAISVKPSLNQRRLNASLLSSRSEKASTTDSLTTKPTLNKRRLNSSLSSTSI